MSGVRQLYVLGNKGYHEEDTPDFTGDKIDMVQATQRCSTKVTSSLVCPKSHAPKAAPTDALVSTSGIRSPWYVRTQVPQEWVLPPSSVHKLAYRQHSRTGFP